MPQENLHAVIFTALAVEYKAVVAFLTDRFEVVHPTGAIYEQGRFAANSSSWAVGIVQLEVGNSSAAIAAERVIHDFNPHVVLFIGVASGIGDVALGDVVAATKVYSYSLNRAGTTFTKFWSSSPDIAHQAREAQSSDWLERLPSVPFPIPRVHVGSIALSGKVVASNGSEISKFLQSLDRNTLAVEMEDYDFFYLVQELQQPVSAIVIRGISDLMDNKDDEWLEQKQIWQEQAAQRASAFAFQLLANFIPDELLTHTQTDPEQSQAAYETISVLRKPQKSQCFTESAIQLDLMLIPAGTFMMGSPSDELGRWNDEGPQHEVTVAAFLMGRYPVTQAQWRAIAIRTDLKVKQDLDPDPSDFKGDDRPVENVSWYEAVEFCDRLSRLTQRTYRLPTEAEWEYACRAKTTTPFHCGETITTELANYRGKDDESDPEEYPGHYGKGPKGEYRASTTPVTDFHPLANAFGLCDMHGNVWEWCLDHWHDDYEGEPTDGSAWLTEDDKANRVIRGGSWCYNPRYCRSACRYYDYPGDRNSYIGFRVVCEVRGL